MVVKSVYLGIRKNKLKELKFEVTSECPEFELSSIKTISNRFNLKLPKKLTLELAEEIGIHIGDGHLSANRARYKIFGNIDESAYYTDFISKLYKNLYNLDIKIVRRPDNTIGFEVSSKLLWNFKTKILGIKPGRKDSIGVPEIIPNSNVKILRAFIRGLFDTDGNLYFQSRYGYVKYYPVISLTSKSRKLASGVNFILQYLGFKVNLYKAPQECTVVILYGYENILKFAKDIGWHNKKHELKFLNWKDKYPDLVNKRAGIGI